MATIYTSHARARMAQRVISEEQVELVLDKAENWHDDPDEQSVRLIKHIGGRLLKVWVVAPWPQGDRAVVKSVAWGN